MQQLNGQYHLPAKIANIIRISMTTEEQELKINIITKPLHSGAGIVWLAFLLIPEAEKTIHSLTSVSTSDSLFLTKVR